MVSIQLKISEEQNKILGIFKALKGLKSKREAIKLLIDEKKELVSKLEG